MEQNFLVEFFVAEWPSHVDVCKQDGRVGIESYPLRQRHLVALGGVSASACSSEIGEGSERPREGSSRQAHSVLDERRVRTTEPSRVL